MKTNCGSIEQYLYLCREGELTPGQRREVEAHCAECPACRSVLAGLADLERIVGPLRTLPAGPEPPRTLAGNIMAAVVHESSARPKPATILSGYLPGWVRPALAYALTGLACLFLVQEYRDASSIAALEQQLAAVGRAAEQPAAGGSIPERLRSGLPPGDLSAINPLDLLRSVFPPSYGKREGLFDELAKKYPDLARISLKRKLDAGDRKVLAAEGQAFLRDVQRLVQEGDQQP